MDLSIKDKKFFNKMQDQAFKLCMTMGRIVYNSKNATLKRIIEELQKEKIEMEINNSEERAWNFALNKAIRIVKKELTTKNK